MTAQFLGTATSLGVPMIGCDCATCTSADPRDRRSRCALLIESGGTCLLIDCGPDIRSQLLRSGTSRIDALLVTHAHSDHLFGLDDLRPVRWGRGRNWRLPTYAHPDTLAAIARVFPWVHEPSEHRDGYLKIDAHPLMHGQAAEIGPFRVRAIEVRHGAVTTFGWLVEADGQRLGYFPDMKEFVGGAEDLLADLDLLVLDCLRDEPHPTHLDSAAAIELAGRLQPRRTLFTHFSHDIRHAELEARLPEGMAATFDSLRVDLARLSLPHPA